MLVVVLALNVGSIRLHPRECAMILHLRIVTTINSYYVVFWTYGST